MTDGIHRVSVLLLSLLCLVITVTCAIALECDEGGNCAGFSATDNGTKINLLQSQEEISAHTSKPAERPKAMNMVHDDEHMLFRPTVPTLPSEEPKGRSLNFTMDENNHDNGLLSNSTSNGTKKKEIDLSDVDMDNDDDDDDDIDFSSFHSELFPDSKLQGKNQSSGICEKGGLTYDNGERLEVGCDSICTCTNGKMDCVDRCSSPFFRKGKKIDDPLCVEQPVKDPCCAVLTCSDTATEPLEICSYKNKTYNRGDKIRSDCTEVCKCDIGGKVSCKPRCPQVAKSSDRCVEIQDPKDICCKTVLCDVTLEEHETEKDPEVTYKQHKILSAQYLNETTIKVDFDNKFGPTDVLPLIEVSTNKTNWTAYRLASGDLVQDIKIPAKYIRLEGENDDPIKIYKNYSTSTNQTMGACSINGKNYELNQEFNVACESLCICLKTGLKCLKIDCPTYFGLDVMDPTCIDWETVPPNFVPTPPQCCPDKLRCKSNGSCEYEGVTYSNWQEIPSNVTGCQKKCYCEMGNVECQNTCPPVPAMPPNDLPCPPHHAILNHLPDDECCMYWICEQPNLPAGIGFPSGFPNIPGFQQPQEDVIINNLEPVDAHTVRLSFSIPPVIVGLHGRVEVRYTHRKNNDDLSSWDLQVFAPPNDLLATPQMEFELSDLRPDTEYKIKVTVTLRDLHNTPTSRVYLVRTFKEAASSTLPPMIPIEPDLLVNDINSTWVVVSWRKFTEYELQFIDGVQLRYKEIDTKVYAATPLIHRAVTSYTIENLKPNTKYEVGIYFIPFSGQLTELHSEHMVHFTTANEVDNYGFNVTLDVSHVKATSVELAWSGVPYPEDKYVNVYRAIYQSDSGKGDSSTYKVAKRDSPSRILIKDLKPGTRYRLWLEVYLTNGRIKTSNVQDFITKPRSAPFVEASHDKLSGDLSDNRGDYYGPLVIVAILAAIAILSTLVLLLILVKRHNQHKASITTPPRMTQSAYDNPTYKVEIQQETMDL